MNKPILTSLAALAAAAVAFPAAAQQQAPTAEQPQAQEQQAAAGTFMQTPPPEGYKKVSELVALPEFVPGLGQLYAQEADLPTGPYIAYDRQGKLASTVYMIPLDEMQEQKDWQLKEPTAQQVQNVAVRYNPGHPGMEEPHYHVVLWHIPEEQAAQLQE